MNDDLDTLRAEASALLQVVGALADKARETYAAKPIPLTRAEAAIFFTEKGSRHLRRAFPFCLGQFTVDLSKSYKVTLTLVPNPELTSDLENLLKTARRADFLEAQLKQVKDRVGDPDTLFPPPLAALAYVRGYVEASVGDVDRY